MGRWTQYDEDSTRLSDGMTRIGYDADTQQYTFQDTDGSLWVGAPGCEYGRMTRVPQTNSKRLSFDEEEGLLEEPEQMGVECSLDDSTTKRYDVEEDVKSSWRMLAPFILLVCLVPVLAYRITSAAPKADYNIPATRDCSSAGIDPIVVLDGDTCWELGEKYSLSLDELKNLNEGLQCEKLRIGEVVCIKNGSEKHDRGQM